MKMNNRTIFSGSIDVASHVNHTNPFNVTLCAPSALRAGAGARPDGDSDQVIISKPFSVFFVS